MCLILGVLLCVLYIVFYLYFVCVAKFASFPFYCAACYISDLYLLYFFLNVLLVLYMLYFFLKCLFNLLMINKIML
jgi:hypothetical protein